MIKKVYKTDEIKKTKKVKKIIPKHIEEKYEEKIPHSRRVYHGPSSSGYCLHCGRKLYSSMWKYQGMEDKYLCPTCWYSLSSYKREEYRKEAQEGYYSSETYYTYETRTRYKTVNEEVEVDEEYTEIKTSLIYPKKIKYNDKNKVYFNKLSLSALLGTKIKNINNDMINSEEGWYGVRDNNINFERFFSKPITENKKYKMWGITDITFNEMIVSEKQTLEEFCDVVGFYPNVPAFIQGHPLSMYNNKRKNIVDLVRSVTIFVNLALDSESDFKQYQIRGNMINGLIDEMLSTIVSANEQIRVNLSLLDASYIDGETIIQKIDIYHDELIKNRNVVYNILTNISFFRLLLLDKKLEFIELNKLDATWKKGQGHILDNNLIRKILNLMDTDIVIGSIEEIGITGIHTDDDHVNFLSSIGLFDDSIIDSIATNIKELSIKEVLKKRNITKLIHVTNKKNLESILENGLLSLTSLEKEGIEYEFNDNLRLEKRRDAICLSVTDYNNFLFCSFQKKYPENEYVVLEIDPKILLIKGIEKIFCDYNAASRFTERSSTNMEIMFKDKIKRKAKIKTRLDKEDNEPTSYQAEILYCGRIDPKYIMDYYDLGRLKLHH